MTPAPINVQLVTAAHVITQVAALAADYPEVTVLWRYGSQVKGNAGAHSDWDLAVACDPITCTGPWVQC
ncbi:MAG: hypothetical protein ACRC9N_11475 [Aeromonas sp.]